MKTDPSREYLDETGIYVRAKKDGKWDSVDITHLDKDSLKEWLGSGNKRAENVVGIILGYGHLHLDQE